jgi:hypothetical protein
MGEFVHFLRAFLRRAFYRLMAFVGIVFCLFPFHKAYADYPVEIVSVVCEAQAGYFSFNSFMVDHNVPPDNSNPYIMNQTKAGGYSAIMPMSMLVTHPLSCNFNYADTYGRYSDKIDVEFKGYYYSISNQCYSAENGTLVVSFDGHTAASINNVNGSCDPSRVLIEFTPSFLSGLYNA